MLGPRASENYLSFYTIMVSGVINTGNRGRMDINGSYIHIPCTSCSLQYTIAFLPLYLSTLKGNRFSVFNKLLPRRDTARSRDKYGPNSAS